jgi:hypothetical protein
MNSLNVFNNSEPNETFEDVKEFLSNIDSINSGGCGLSALVMYRWLKKYNKLTEDIKIIFLDNDENNYMNNKECMSNKQGTLKAPTHIVILYDSFHIDCAGVQYNIAQRYNYVLEVAEDYLVNSLNNIPTWNVQFDRDEAISVIENNLHIDLSDIARKFY